jgi:APA family basic amino acid/polyamine antiporter
MSADGVSGIINAPALVVLTIITLILIKGTQESAIVNAIIVFIKVSIVLVFIGIGWKFINPTNYVPFMIPADAPDIVSPNGDVHNYTSFFNHGWGGIFHGAAYVFFAFIGFDAVSTAAQETRNPKRDMPIGILGSLVVCTILYVLFSHVLTGVANYKDFVGDGREASVAYTIMKYMSGYSWLATLVSAAILAGFSTVILAMLFGQSRVFFSMSKDGLLPKVFSELHPTFRTPYKSNLILLVFTGIIAGFIPENLTGTLTSIGTLFAFVLVCAGIWIMRRTNPEVERPFRTPFVPLVPILGAIVCTALIISLDAMTQIVAFVWLLIGLAIYFIYSKKHSGLRNGKS